MAAPYTSIGVGDFIPNLGNLSSKHWKLLTRPIASGLMCALLANVAQLVEQLIRNEQVIGSTPIIGSNFQQTT